MTRLVGAIPPARASRRSFAEGLDRLRRPSGVCLRRGEPGAAPRAILRARRLPTRASRARAHEIWVREPKSRARRGCALIAGRAARCPPMQLPETAIAPIRCRIRESRELCCVVAAGAQRGADRRRGDPRRAAPAPGRRPRRGRRGRRRQRRPHRARRREAGARVIRHAAPRGVGARLPLRRSPTGSSTART